MKSNKLFQSQQFSIKEIDQLTCGTNQLIGFYADDMSR